MWYHLDILEENEYQAKVSVDPDARSWFCHAHTVAYGMKSAVEEALYHKDVITPVQFTNWAAPIVLPGMARQCKLWLLS